jgi:2,5-diketo-D-gluconate reductase B
MSVDWAEIPRLGLGTSGRTGARGLDAILAAIDIGYRHLDTAQTYDTEVVIGRAMARSGLPRSAFFITTKVADTNLARADFLPSLRESLDRLRLERVDLTLIHWPAYRDVVPFEEYMQELMQARAGGLTTLIGVSNFPAALVRRAVALAGPGAIANNQVEMHPFLQNRRVHECCDQHHVAVTAYLPIARGLVADEPVLRRIGARHGVGAEAVSLAWLLHKGAIVIPASSRREHLAANWRAAALTLAPDEMTAIDALDRNQRLVDPDKSPAWD